MGEEGLEKTAHNKIFVAEPLDITMENINEKLDSLNKLLEKEEINKVEVINTFKQIVPTFKEPEEVNQKQK